MKLKQYGFGLLWVGPLNLDLFPTLTLNRSYLNHLNSFIFHILLFILHYLLVAPFPIITTKLQYFPVQTTPWGTFYLSLFYYITFFFIHPPVSNVQYLLCFLQLPPTNEFNSFHNHIAFPIVTKYVLVPHKTLYATN